LAHSAGSLARQTLVLAVACCLGAAYTASALGQTGPDSGTGQPQGPAPDPSPAATSHAPSPPPAAAPTTTTAQVTPTVARTAPARIERKQASRQGADRKKPVGKPTTTKAPRAAVSAVEVKRGDPPNRMLMLGGLALFALVLFDTVFLTLSTRATRGI
jgi:hypothetical protein